MPSAPDKSDSPEISMRRRLLGFFMFPVALFPLLALVSYNWRHIPDLCVPPQPTTNLIGVAGDTFAYAGYQLMGLAVWAVPVLCVCLGFFLIAGISLRLGRRTAGLLLLILAATCLLQIAGASATVRPVLHHLNIEPNAGGAVGYLIMTRALSRWLSPFGASVLMVSLMVFAVFLVIGFKNLVAFLAFLTSWAADRQESEAADAPPAAGSAADNARAAREAALAARQAEKDRIAAEKAMARAEKEAAREEARRQREEQRAAREEERRRAEEEKEQLIARLRAARAPLNPPPAAPTPSPSSLPSSPAAPTPPPSSLVPSPSPLVPPQEYVIPPLTLLDPPQPAEANPVENVQAMAQRLVDTLKVFDVDAELAYSVPGPVVTQYALTLSLGTRVERVASLASNLQMALEATSIRIEAPIPGKNAVGIEVPNAKPASVRFGEIAAAKTWKEAVEKFELPLLIGKDAAGNDLVADLTKMPHLLVAGATGQGKSVCLNSFINGFLMSRTPEQLRLIMVDPKRVEFTSYSNLPHLLVPVINENKKVVFGLRWAVLEMDRRLKLFKDAKCRNIVEFNRRKIVTQPDMFGGEERLGDKKIPRTVPYIVIILDEVADIMQAAQRDVEPVIARLTALARATGIHLILATQRPDAKIITGKIKSNIPGRISFKTSSSIDARTILDATGSESLIGKGDMLFRTPDNRLVRAQGSYISDAEIERIISFIGEHATAQFDEKLTQRLEKIKEDDPAEGLGGDDGDADGADAPPPDPLSTTMANGMPPPAGMTASKEEQMYNAALVVLRDTRRASTSHLQRRMGIGYNHAARLIDLLEERGVIGQARGAGPREILSDPETLLNPAGDTPADDPAAAPLDAADADGLT